MIYSPDQNRRVNDRDRRVDDTDDTIPLMYPDLTDPNTSRDRAFSPGRDVQDKLKQGTNVDDEVTEDLDLTWDQDDHLVIPAFLRRGHD